MMTLTENAAYLKGLAEGLDLDESKPEGKLITKMLALISDMADSISDLEDECEELRGYIEEIDDDLAIVEDDLYEDEDEYPFRASLNIKPKIQKTILATRIWRNSPLNWKKTTTSG